VLITLIDTIDTADELLFIPKTSPRWMTLKWISFSASLLPCLLLTIIVQSVPC